MQLSVASGVALLMVAAFTSKLAGCSREDPDAATSTRAPGHGVEVTPAATTKPGRESCLACERSDPGCATLVDICGTLEGKAEQGPRAGRAKKELCQSAMDCIERTRCAAEHVSRCYCGNTQGTECLEGKASGPCKAELEAALESTDPLIVGKRFDEEAYAGAYPTWRAQCQQRVCAAQCF